MEEKRKNKGNVPNLRFQGFNGDWELKKLGDLLEFKNGINASKEQYGSGVKFINVTDILKNNFITHDGIIGKVNVDKYTAEKYSVKYGDIVFQRSSETREEVGTANVYLDETNNATFGGFVIRGRKIGNYEPYFLNNLLKTRSARENITSKSGGSTRYNVGQDILSSVILGFPTIKEQEKIGQFLRLIDTRILTQIKIIEELKSQLSILSKSLFDQKTKFKDVNGEYFSDWEFRPGNNLFDAISNRNDGSKLPILAITQEHGAIPRNLINYKVTVSDKSVDSYKIVEIGDFIISLRSFQGGIEYSRYRGICSPAYIILRAKIPIDDRFYRLYLRTESYIRLLNLKLEGIRDGKMISYKNFSDISIPYPSLKEQVKIADFLSSIEDKILIEENILEKYVHQKRHILASILI